VVEQFSLPGIDPDRGLLELVNPALFCALMPSLFTLSVPFSSFSSWRACAFPAAPLCLTPGPATNLPMFSLPSPDPPGAALYSTESALFMSAVPRFLLASHV